MYFQLIYSLSMVEKSDIKDVVPQMHVSLPELQPAKELIEDERLLGIYDEILNNLRTDRSQVDEVLGNFLEMVMNQGDSSTSSKEAVVNLLKLKIDSADKMTKIGDLMTRIKMKDTNTYKPYLSAKQDNKTTINISGNKRKILEAIRKQTDKEETNE